MTQKPVAHRWLVLIHQLPRTPAYLRAKVGRQLARVGAIAIKNSVYVLPFREDTREDFQWIAREIQSAKAEVSVLEASVLDGLTDEQIESRFRETLALDWKAMVGEATVLLKALRKSKRARLELHEAEVSRLRKRTDELREIDFFAAPGGTEAAALVVECERLARPAANAGIGVHPDQKSLLGRTWATRKGIHVDRIASAWFIRRFIDSGARIVFTARNESAADPGVLRFDTFGGEFTHEGDLCTFEVLAGRTANSDPAIAAIAEIVHDLDLKDGKYRRPEGAGVSAALAGICWVHASDDERLSAGTELFNALYEFFRRSVPSAKPRA